MTPPVGLALVAGAAVSGLIVLLLGIVAVGHAARTRRQARDERRKRELTPLVHALLDDDPTDGVALPDMASAPADLDEVVLGLLPSLRGSDRTALRQLLAERGVVARAVTDLTARKAWRRGRAVALLGSAAGTNHTAALAARLDDRSAEVRCAAARALGKAGDPAAVGFLLAAVTGRRPLPRGVAGMALLDLGTAALPGLREVLLAQRGNVRVLVAELLGLNGDLSAAPLLESVLRDREEPRALRVAAAGALGRIGSPRSTDALAAELTSSADPELRRAAAEALGRIGDPVAATPLLAGLAAPYAAVRTACADALAGLGPEGRDHLEEVAAGTGIGAPTARAALDESAVLRPRLAVVR